ncbi:hypothetical protein F885_03688 [Acinetobacter higginsii]|nr:hypothetical protein F885_03688 [Acinetobacter higginsii]
MQAEHFIRLKVNKPSKFSLKYDTRKCHLQPEQAKATKALAKRKKGCNKECLCPYEASNASQGETKVGRTAGLS